MKAIMVIGSVSAGLSVILGAFAAHGLKTRLPENLLSAFETGVQYQMYHSLALIVVALLYRFYPHHLMPWVAYVMLAGIVLFSGSLYVLAMTRIHWFGPVTPLGGLCFIVSWLMLAYAIWQSPN